MDRRSFLTATVALALTGCAQPAASASPRRIVEPVAFPSDAYPSPTPSSPTISPTPSHGHPMVPTREETIARYAGSPAREWGFAVTGVLTHASGASPGAALTFDACGGPGGTGVDLSLIAVLRRLHVPATLMLNGRWVQANAGIAAELAADPLFEIQSHGMSHQPLSTTGRAAYGIPGLTDVGAVYDELVSASPILTRLTGKPVRFFRSGTAFCDEVAAAIAIDLGTPIVNFTVNADAGATFTPAQVATQLASVGPGDVVISHMNKPGSGTADGYAIALPTMMDKGVQFVTLSQVFP